VHRCHHPTPSADPPEALPARDSLGAPPGGLSWYGIHDWVSGKSQDRDRTAMRAKKQRFETGDCWSQTIDVVELLKGKSLGAVVHVHPWCPHVPFGG
jgi:hypothetical protein